MWRREIKIKKMMKESKKIELLKKQVKNGALPHAYLFSGIDEKGKKDAIEYLLDELHPQTKKSGAPNADLYIIESDPISIDDVRLIKEQSSQSPLYGEKNIFIIKNIDRLSWQAAPAMLKLLEEPSATSFILATTENVSRVLPTILSRFAHLKFPSFAKASEGKFGGSNFNTTIKPPHENPREFSEFVRGAVSYARQAMRSKPTPSNVDRLARTLRAMDALSDPTINKRLLGEYIIMVLL